MRGYEPGHHGAQCRPEVSVPMTAAPRITVPRRGGLEIDTAHDSPYCPEAEDVLKIYCVDQDPEIKDAQLKELERWSEYTVFEKVPKRN